MLSEFRDQGFTRPRVLVVLPFRNSAYTFINNLIALSGTTQHDNKARFVEEFNDDSEPRDDKPSDYKEVFKGNVDDGFRIGIKFTRKTMKLYSDFYSSDVVIASPLGLRLIVGEEGDKKRDVDFLSSIEVVIIDQCDVLLMQNWSHLEHVLNHLNCIPKESHGTDFSRVKHWYLDQCGKYLRQTIICSAIVTPEINAMFNRCTNVFGRWRSRRMIDKGSIAQATDISQLFHRLNPKSISTSDNERFSYFCAKILDPLKQSATNHTLIFVSSYVDFVRIRNYMETNRFSYGTLCEYTSESSTSRNRARFQNGQRNLLLITERMHFFRRFRIKGVRHVVFYSLPEYPHFYPEVVKWIGEGEVEVDMSVRALYTPFDRLKLERIVGDKRAAKMVSDGQSVFMFN